MPTRGEHDLALQPCLLKEVEPPLADLEPEGTGVHRDGIEVFLDLDGVRYLLPHHLFAELQGHRVAEVVHDGDAFNGFYVEQSTRTLIAGGIRYELLRRDGWTGTRLEISAFAIDEDGNEGTL